ncbi:hypothetical protein [Paraburkholderia sp. RL17-381-BIF-C]|uniref:hypothetical protein n=1 Tax=Paraburkholderia sp. RL17-381-BIF-C TaxID=3031635 RepID=UPI0038B947BC
MGHVRPKRFKEALGKPIFVQPPGLIEIFSSEEHAHRRYSDAANTARAEKLLLLFDHYDIPHGRFAELAMALAIDFVPGFQVETERRRVGPRTKWDDLANGYLAVEIERLIEKNPRLNVTSAAGHLAKREPWKDMVRGSNVGETLRQKYQEAKDDRWTTVCRDAYRYHEASGTLAEWDAAILNLGW